MAVCSPSRDVPHVLRGLKGRHPDFAGASGRERLRGRQGAPGLRAPALEAQVQVQVLRLRTTLSPGGRELGVPRTLRESPA